MNDTRYSTLNKDKGTRKRIHTMIGHISRESIYTYGCKKVLYNIMLYIIILYTIVCMDYTV